VGDSQFGPVLVDGAQQAIYLFAAEDTIPSCYQECAVAWPPVLTQGAPVAARGIDRSVLATTARADGSIQVTYRGHPLYYYAHEGPREVTCHDVEEFGGLWLAVRPDGHPVGS
jgi:predicted lipoprotein with Yx(FWY)xxD motif